jgi:hypothetical protein
MSLSSNKKRWRKRRRQHKKVHGQYLSWYVYTIVFVVTCGHAIKSLITTTSHTLHKFPKTREVFGRKRKLPGLWGWCRSCHNRKEIEISVLEIESGKIILFNFDKMNFHLNTWRVSFVVRTLTKWLEKIDKLAKREAIEEWDQRRF